jgi:hypothetical protein
MKAMPAPEAAKAYADAFAAEKDIRVRRALGEKPPEIKP